MEVLEIMTLAEKARCQDERRQGEEGTEGTSI